MKTKRKKCKVIMLPTEDKSTILYWKDTLKLECFKKYKQPVELNHPLSIQYIHLYIISDDEIKEGDYGILGNIIHRFSNDIGKPDKGKYVKIIATTDKSLTLGCKDIKCVNGCQEHYHKCMNPRYLPQPSKAFIEKYCKVGGIDEVMVEFDIIQPQGYDTVTTISKNPKVNSHNEITIHPIKDSWSREEVIKLCTKALYAKGAWYEDEVDDWIKENL